MRRMRRTASLMRRIETSPLATSLPAEVAEVGRDHLRVGAGVQRQARGVPAVLGHAVAARAAGRVLARAGAQLGHRGVVALDEAVEAPLPLEDAGLQVAVRAARHAVDGVERAHERVRARVDRGLEGRQVEVPEPLERHVGGAVVAPRVGLAVGGEVLDARDHLVGSAVVVALGAPNPRRGHDRVQVRILARRLGDAAPARLVREIDHRAVDLLEARPRPTRRRRSGGRPGPRAGRSCWRRRGGWGRSSGSRGSCRRRTGSGCRAGSFSTASRW